MNNLKRKILDSNIQEHIKEAKYYDIIHTELYNGYEQNRIMLSLNKITKNFNKNCEILEVGSGTGNLTIKLLDHGFKNITCLDISKEMIQELGKKVRNYDHNIRFIVSDIDSFLESINSKFDLVVMGSVLHHLPDYIVTLKNVRNIVNEKGLIYITHEPLPPSKNSIFIKILLKIDFFIYTCRYLFLISISKLKYLNRNCEYSDYHTGVRAIDISQLDEVLGNYRIRSVKYPVAKFAFTAFLLEKMNYTNSFELLAIKKRDTSGKTF